MVSNSANELAPCLFVTSQWFVCLPGQVIKSWGNLELKIFHLKASKLSEAWLSTYLGERVEFLFKVFFRKSLTRWKDCGIWKGLFKVWFCLQNGGSFVRASNLFWENPLGRSFLCWHVPQWLECVSAKALEIHGVASTQGMLLLLKLAESVHLIS